MTRRTALLAAASAALVVATLAPAAPAASQPRASGTIALASAPRVAPPDGPARLDLTVSATPGTELRWRVFDAVCSRSELEQGQLTPLRRAVTGGPISIDGTAIPPLEVRLPAEADRPRSTCRSSIFPVEVELSDPGDDEPLDTLLVHVAQDQGIVLEPLAVALHLPLHLPVALQPDGTTVLDDEAVASLAAELDILTAHTDVAITLTLTPESVVALATVPDGAELLDDLRTIVSAPTAELLAAPYVRVDEAGWWRDGFDDLLDLQYASGTAALERTLGVTPSSRTVVLDPTARPDTLDQLRDRGARAVVAEAATLTDLDADRFDLTLTQRFVLRTGDGDPIPAAVIDAGTRARFGSDPLEASELLTDLMVLAQDQPTTPRGVVLEPPDDWQPSAGFLRELLSGLRDNPLLEPVTLSGFFAPGEVGIADTRGQHDRTGPPEPLVRRLTPVAAPITQGYQGPFNLFRAGLDSYGAIRGGDADAEIAPLVDRLIVAGSQDLSDDERSAYFTAVNDTVAAAIAGVRGPEPETITLTARSGDIPITIVNELGYQASVVLVLESDKLEFPEGAELPWVLRPGVNDDILVPVRARTSGDSLLQVTVRSPDLRLQLGTTGRVTVRSTALSGLGVVMSIAALALLLVWWARAIRRTRREKAAAGSLAGAAPPPEEIR